MDKQNFDKLQELTNVQLKISSLFKDLINEKNDFKQKSEYLNKQLVQMNDEMLILKSEVESLKVQNEDLRLINENMKNVIDKGVKIFRTLDYSQENLIKEGRTELETFKAILLECNAKVGNPKVTNEIKKEKKDNNKAWQSNKEIEKEFEDLSNLHFCTEFFCDEEFNKNSPKKDCVVNRSNPETILKSVPVNTHDIVKKQKEYDSGCENDTFKSELVSSKFNTNIIRTVEASPEILLKESQPNRSPVFKDFGVRRNESLSSEESGSGSFSSLPTKLINEKFLERSHEFLSPWKKSPHQKKVKSPSSPKRVKRQLIISSPDRSPLLKKSNTREAEISVSGIRKLRQTFLNVNCYKKISKENRENETAGGDCDAEDENKTNIEDDDIISESPKKADQVLEDLRKKKSWKELNGGLLITPPQSSDTDLDETFISSSVMRNCNLKTKHELGVIAEDRTPLKRQAREKSPEYDSVPFVYKREPVRKRAERMKLPGHACAECNKYYKDVFEDIGTQDLKKILNKCSRHRDKNSPGLDDTPPGYWKPFLTCSTFLSPNKNDDA